MKNDEFNSFKISNEKEGFSNFEFGKAQNVEFSFKNENTTKMKDELNDNRNTNNENFAPKKNKKTNSSDQSKELLKQTNSSSSSSSTTSTTTSSATSASTTAASTASSVATIASASVVTVTTVSTIVGINVFFNAKVQMNNLDSTPVSIKYDLDLSETNNDKFIINIENKENNFVESKDLVEGSNVGYFEKLLPSTKYTLSVIDTSYNNYVLYTNEVTTLNEVIKVSKFNNFKFDYSLASENKFAISLDIIDEKEIYNNLQISFMDYFDPEQNPENMIDINITKESNQVITSSQLNYTGGLYYYALTYLDKADSHRHNLEYGVVDFPSIEKNYFSGCEISDNYFVIDSKPYISLKMQMNDFDNMYGDIYFKYLLSGETTEKQVRLKKINNGSQYVELDATPSGNINITNYKIVSNNTVLFEDSNFDLEINNASKIYGANFVSTHISESNPELEINIVHNDYDVNNISNVKLELYDSYPPNIAFEYDIDLTSVNFINNNLRVNLADISSGGNLEELLEFIKGSFIFASISYNVSGIGVLQSQDIYTYTPVVLSLEK